MQEGRPEGVTREDNMGFTRHPLSPYRPLDWTAVRRLPAALPGWFRISAETYLAYARQQLAGQQSESRAFLVFAMGRTGSSLLTSLLRCHPDIGCEGEILSRRIMGYTPCPRVWLRGRKALHHRLWYGFKLKLYHLTVDQKVRKPAGFLAGLDGEGWKIIHLRRRNILRQALSNLRLVITGTAHCARPDERPEEKMMVDTDWVVEQMRVRKAIGEQEEGILASLPNLSLVYEDDLEDERHHQNTADRVFAFLGVPSVAVQAGLAKIHVDSLRDIIANYDEVRSTLAGTPYAAYLDE